MSQQSLPPKAPLSTVVNNNNLIKKQQKPKKIIGSPVTNKFFKSSISSSLPRKPIMNKSNSKSLQLMDREVNNSRIIYSEDVSRKKLKLDKNNRKKRCYSTLNDSEDFLENLKKNFDKKSMSQPVLEKDIQATQKSQRKRKPLFTDESLNLMNNCKKYFKDNILQDLSDRGVSETSNINKSSTAMNQENIDNQIDTPENHNSFGCNYRTPSRESRQLNVMKSMTSSCSTVLVKNDDLFGGSTYQHNEAEIQNMISPLRSPDLSFKSRAMLENIDDHIDQLSSPELPQVDILSFQYSHYSGKPNAKNSNLLSHFFN